MNTPNDIFSILSWNLQVGSDAPLIGNGWGRRKHAFVATVRWLEPDIWCMQEPTKEQLNFIQSKIGGYKCVGVARDDGKRSGEYCALLVRSERFEIEDASTFWLSDTPEKPSTWDLFYKRICTWCKLNDRNSGKTFHVFNTHFPLQASAQPKSAHLIVRKIESIANNSSVILAGDFNCGPDSPTWKIFRESGLTCLNDAKTYHLNGRAIICIDGIFLSEHFSSNPPTVIDQSIQGTYPSDHFGVFQRLSIE